MSDVFRAKALAGEVIEAKIIDIALGNGVSLYMGITVGKKPLMIESAALYGTGIENILVGLHQDEGFTAGTPAILANLDAQSSDTLETDVIADVIPGNPSLEPENGRFVGAPRNSQSGTAPLILKPETNYIIQIKNFSGTVQRAIFTVEFSEKR